MSGASRGFPTDQLPGSAIESSAFLRWAFRAAVGALVALVLTFAGLDYLDRERTRRILHGRDVGRAARDAMRLALDLERIARAPSRGPLEQDGAYRQLRDSLTAVVASLAEQSQVEGLQRARVAGLERAIEAWEASLPQAASARDAAAAGSGARETPEFARVRRTIQSIVATQDVVYERRLAQDRWWELVTVAVILAELVVILGALVLLRRRLTKQSRHILSQRDVLLEQNARLTQQAGELSDQAMELEQRTEELEVQAGEMEEQAMELEQRTVELQAANDELRRNEVQLRMSQKMEAMGQLAGGIAHDFNNLLTVIGSYSALLVEQLADRPDIQAEAGEIRTASERAAWLTRQLLTFSRKSPVHPRMLDLNVVVEQGTRMLRRVIGSNVQITTTPAPQLGWIHADQGQVEQVLMNLAINARDAMPDGGQLTIATSGVSVGTADHHDTLAPGRYVALRVSDTGTGISDDVRTRIFEPFFTTKEPSRGTGLGLSTVYGIVTSLGGHIDVSGTSGGGTTFTVYFREAEPEPLTAHEDNTPIARSAATGRILVVEDDEAVRRVIVDTLRRGGFDVTAAADGREALVRLGAAASLPDLLVSDMVMPHMGGRALLTAVRERWPTLRVVLMSGHTSDPSFQEAPPPGVGVLSKPFTPDVLLATVRDALAGRDPRRRPTPV